MKGLLVELWIYDCKPVNMGVLWDRVYLVWLLEFDSDNAFQYSCVYKRKSFICMYVWPFLYMRQ